MTVSPADLRDRERVMRLFGVAQLPDHLEELRVPAGDGRSEIPRDLLDGDLVRYRTETGIAFQEPDDWDIVLTERGMRLLRPAEVDEPPSLA